MVDTQEYGVVLQTVVVRMWQAGENFAAIASYLNSQKVPPRLDRRWYLATIPAVVERYLARRKAMV